MTAPFTQGTPELIAKAKAESVTFFGLAGRGATAPGAVVVRHLPHNSMHPYVVHFANTQCGGYHSGEYCENAAEANLLAYRRAQRYDPDGALRDAFAKAEAEASNAGRMVYNATGDEARINTASAGCYAVAVNGQIFKAPTVEGVKELIAPLGWA